MHSIFAVEESPITPKTPNRITSVAEFHIEPIEHHFTSLYSHKILLGKLVDDEKLWFRKEITSPAYAKHEVLAQEIFRLILPRQPVTKLAYDPITNLHYVLSAEIKGFHPFDESIKVSSPAGLGTIMTMAYFVQETDLKNGNIGLGEDGLVYKIDSDWSFSSLRSTAKYPPHTGIINAFQLKALPWLRNYHTYHWLDIAIEGRVFGSSKILAAMPDFQTQFDYEKYETMLLLSLIPASIWTQMTEHFFSAGSEPYLEFLLQRQQMLIQESKKIRQFQAYVVEHHESLRSRINLFLEHLKIFQIEDKYPLVTESEFKAIKIQVERDYANLLDSFEHAHSERLRSFKI